MMRFSSDLGYALDVEGISVNLNWFRYFGRLIDLNVYAYLVARCWEIDNTGLLITVAEISEVLHLPYTDVYESVEYLKERQLIQLSNHPAVAAIVIDVINLRKITFPQLEN